MSMCLKSLNCEELEINLCLCKKTSSLFSEMAFYRFRKENVDWPVMNRVSLLSFLASSGYTCGLQLIHENIQLNGLNYYIFH